jgi:hypothetical protein
MNKIRTRSLTIVLAAMAMTTIASCSKECGGHGQGEYINRAKGFKISFPEGWEVRESQMGLDVIALSPLSSSLDKFRDNVSVASTNMSAALTADQILDSNLLSMMRVITDFKPEERGAAQLNGRKAAWITYTMLQGQFRLKVKRYAVPGETRAYLIDCTAETTAAKDFQDQFEQIIQSFRVTE